MRLFLKILHKFYFDMWYNLTKNNKAEGNKSQHKINKRQNITQTAKNGSIGEIYAGNRIDN